MTPIILDNALPISFVNEIEFTLSNVEFNWHYNSNISYDSQELVDQFIVNDPNIVETRGFVHRFFFEGKKASTYCDFIRPILYFVENNVSINSIERIRGVLAPRDVFPGKYNVPHVDMHSPHKTLIYYVNDSDGGTILFKEHHSGNIYNPSKKTIAHEIQAKKGRIVIFDGLCYHTGRIPVENDKMLININFI